MGQKCYASISDTGLHCAWCVVRKHPNTEMTEAFCEKHNAPCEQLGYYCSSFLGFKPDYWMSDEEEMDLVEKLRNKVKKGE